MGKHWWKRKKRISGNQGDYALDLWGNFIDCPKCKEYKIVYNGNYFCDNWAFKPKQGDCDWALPHPTIHPVDREICDKIGIDYN